MTDNLNKITEEIKEYIEKVGTASWRAGVMLIGKDASIDQIANLLSKQWDMDKDIIKNAMNRVKKPT